MRDLPDVTLFVLDGGVAQELTQIALLDTLMQITPARTIVFTLEPDFWSDFETIKINRCRSSQEMMRVLWYLVPENIKTSHMLHVEWDGWVLDGRRWDDEFLEYDYIGAPWPQYTDGFAVGNGLGLRSARLMKFLGKNPFAFPFPHPEDHHICRTYRTALEREGFRWPNVEVACRFSWERGEFPGPTFMFHGAFNWPEVLSDKALRERITLVDAYVRSHTSFKELGLAVA